MCGSVSVNVRGNAIMALKSFPGPGSLASPVSQAGLLDIVCFLLKRKGRGEGASEGEREGWSSPWVVTSC